MVGQTSLWIGLKPYWDLITLSQFVFFSNKVPNNRILGKELYTEEGSCFCSMSGDTHMLEAAESFRKTFHNDSIEQLGAPALPGSLIQIALPAVPLPGAIEVAKEAQLLLYHSSL